MSAFLRQLMFIIASIIPYITWAQNDALLVKYANGADNAIDFTYEKNEPGSFTIAITFTDLSNAYANTKPYTVADFSGRLFTLNPVDRQKGINFSYKYSYIRGKLNAKPDAGFIYVLPFKKGVQTRVFESVYVSAQYFGNTSPDDWKAYRFYTDSEDTVTAIRKGIVVSVKDIYENNSAEDLAYTSSVNTVIVEQPDGTLATYRGFKKGSIVVKPGQIVLPGDALGLNSKYDVHGGYNVSLIITYLKSAEFEAVRGKTLKTTKSLYGFVTPKFYTDAGALVLQHQTEYTTAITDEIIKKELSKKELKRLSH